MNRRTMIAAGGATLLGGYALLGRGRSSHARE